MPHDDVFAGVVRDHRAFLADATLHAAFELGVFEALTEPLTSAELAARLGVGARRLSRALDALVLEGVLGRDACGHVFVRRRPSRPSVPPAAGWGPLADCIRRDRPLPPPDETSHHQHLASVATAAAADLLAHELRGAERLLDLGGGSGGYTRALLDSRPSTTATLVDRPPVITLARAALADLADRVELLAADLFDPPPAGSWDTALLANVLHLHPPEACQTLVCQAAAALSPGGMLVVKDVALASDRSGPALGVWFALNMALYTEAGDVHPTECIEAWLEACGLAEVATRRAGEGQTVVVSGRAPPDDGPTARAASTS